MKAIPRDLSYEENAKDFLIQLDIKSRIKKDKAFMNAIRKYLKEQKYNHLKSFDDIVNNISKSVSRIEKKLNIIDDSNTLNNPKTRRFELRSDEKRKELRENIRKNCLSQLIKEHEKDITLTDGGMALNRNDTKFEGKIFVIVGGPASGKSSYAKLLVDYFGAYLVDSDIIKKKIPEYYDYEYGASLVHDESNFIEKEILSYLLSSRANVVMPITGKQYQKTLDMIKEYRDVFQYDVTIILLKIDRGEATLRALQRFCENKRYVSLSYIYDVCGHEAVASFYRIACENRTFRMLSIDNTDKSNRRKGVIEYKQNCDDVVEALKSKLSD